MNNPEVPDWECRVELRIVGFDGSPNSISTALGLQPSRAWVANDPEIKGPLRKEGGWILKSELPTTCVPAEHVLALLDKLPRGLDVLGSVRGWRGFFLCAVYVRSRTPPIFLEAPLVAAIAKLGIGLDVDLYVCPVGAQSL